VRRIRYLLFFLAAALASRSASLPASIRRQARAEVCLSSILRQDRLDALAIRFLHGLDRFGGFRTLGSSTTLYGFDTSRCSGVRVAHAAGGRERSLNERLPVEVAPLG
jgi:hypothetical protein